MARYRIVHKTTYHYKEDVSLCHSEARLLPRNLPYQQCVESSLTISPRASFSSERYDYFGNRATYFAMQDNHRLLEITAASLVDVEPRPNPEGTPTRAWEEIARELATNTNRDLFYLRDFVMDSPMIRPQPDVNEYAAPSFAPGRPLLEGCLDLMHRIYRDFKYESGFSEIGTPLSRVLEHRRGVCQDFAHLFIAALRGLRLPVRYVSGYIETAPPPGKPRLQGADASHAWASAFIPELGWIDFDPTNDRIIGLQHITLGWGRDYSDVTPLKGVLFGGGDHEIKVAVDVIPANEAA